MFSSILCAAHWRGWRPEISHWAIVLGDQPHLGATVLRNLLDFHGQNRDKICQPAIGERTGHPVMLPRWVFEALKRTRAETLKDFLKHLAGSCVQLEMAAPAVLLDLDTPEDYKRLQSR
jgi:molybdenum cofactor cytidylyltransferase